MTDDRLPLLRGRITAVDTYQAPQNPVPPPRLPSLDPHEHSEKLLNQLDAIRSTINSRSVSARDELATREIIAIQPFHGADLTPNQLDDSKEAWLIGEVPETGAILLDVADGDLGYLRKKIEAFADDSKVILRKCEDGTPKLDKNGVQIISRASETAVAPIETLKLASFDDVCGPRLRTEELSGDRAYWFEVTCRGGYRNPGGFAASSRTQIARQLNRLGLPLQKFEEFSGPEYVYYFLRLTNKQLEALIQTTDCIYEVELAPPAIRDMKLIDTVTSIDIKSFYLQAPPAEAPAVVLMDTGIATEHVLLKSALLPPAVASVEIPGPEDTHGHGTQMAGLALYGDLGAAIEQGHHIAGHWIQSSRLLVRPHSGTADDENYEKWPILTQGAVRAAEDADSRARNRVFAMAITRTMQDPPFAGLVPTLWSHAVDVVAFGEGQGRLFIVSAGNARESQWLALAEQYPQLQLSEKIHDPAQAANALTVGAFTERVELPPGLTYSEYHVVATKPGGISPFTSTGVVGGEWHIKPDVVMEGGNLAVSQLLYDPGIDTLSALTTQRTQIAGKPLTTLNMTSEATAHCARLAATIWSAEPKLRAESVRGLIVHSASWTTIMLEQFPSKNDLLLACGYGVPDERLASECAHGVATIVVEDKLPNAVLEEEPKKKAPKRPDTKMTEQRLRRKVKLYRLPIPESLLLDSDPDVKLRVTLSCFAEPNKFGRNIYNGLDLKWDMQGPQESENEFLQRINLLKCPLGLDGKRVKGSTKKSFDWDIGIKLRSRGTVQSDRWCGKMSELVGDKLIAIVPVLGWWDQRKSLRTQEMHFSLIVSVFGPGVYTAIKPKIEAQTAITINI
jgi:hypothetical protein